MINYFFQDSYQFIVFSSKSTTSPWLCKSSAGLCKHLFARWQNVKLCQQSDPARGKTLSHKQLWPANPGKWQAALTHVDPEEQVPPVTGAASQHLQSILPRCSQAATGLVRGQACSCPTGWGFLSSSTSLERGCLPVLGSLIIHFTSAWTSS